MSRPKIYDNPAERDHIGSRNRAIFTSFLPVFREKFPCGRKITAKENMVSEDGHAVSRPVALTTVKAYGRFVLFVDGRNVKHTYTYQELVKMGYVS